MKAIVRVSKSFKRLAKPLLRKYPSLTEELRQLENELSENPRKGIALGYDAYKIRIRVKSKGKGKSGGLRIISKVDTEIIGLLEIDGSTLTVTLISIYDKAETPSLKDNELLQLIAKMHIE
jgi:mRNA-degrading endonuclease RelE of RelBE toxin-antitoxin system